MKKEDEFFEDGDKLDEELLEFEFDLSEEDLGGKSGDSSPDEEVIELVDVVEDGDTLEDLESDEIAMELDADELMEEAIGDEDLESSGEPELELELDDSDLEGLEAEFDDLTEGPSEEAGTELDIESIEEAEEAEEAPEFDLEALAKAEALEEKSAGEDLGEKVPEQDIVPDLVDLAEAETYGKGAVEEAEEEKIEEALSTELQARTEPEAFTAKGYPIAISEERVEEIIREVVADVVERVARETMVSVAEKVIGEAIDALKQSLESPSE